MIIVDMKRIFLAVLSTTIVFSLPLPRVSAQEEARAAWQVTNFDIRANVQQADTTLNAVAVLGIRNVGKAAGSSLTIRISSKPTITSRTVSGGTARFPP